MNVARELDQITSSQLVSSVSARNRCGMEQPIVSAPIIIPMAMPRPFSNHVAMSLTTGG